MLCLWGADSSRFLRWVGVKIKHLISNDMLRCIDSVNVCSPSEWWKTLARCSSLRNSSLNTKFSQPLLENATQITYLNTQSGNSCFVFKLAAQLDCCDTKSEISLFVFNETPCCPAAVVLASVQPASNPLKLRPAQLFDRCRCQSRLPAIWHQHRYGEIHDSTSHSGFVLLLVRDSPAAQPCLVSTEHRVWCEWRLNPNRLWQAVMERRGTM